MRKPPGPSARLGQTGLFSATHSSLLGGGSWGHGLGQRPGRHGPPPASPTERQYADITSGFTQGGSGHLSYLPPPRQPVSSDLHRCSYPSQGNLSSLGKSGVGSSGFPAAIPGTPAAAKQKPELPHEELPKTSVQAPPERPGEAGEFQEGEHSIPTRAGSHSPKGTRGTGYCPHNPQLIRLQPSGSPAPPLWQVAVGAHVEAGGSIASSQVSKKERSWPGAMLQVAA
ncbi:calcium-binding protein P-like [Piliocolobus tephrosceles]|uniref:calcium-binding protein P-like n=1 Tax=Piliocolobus tephrosceles TaxID=591936 RepID=UPI000C299333|nr:calcium-binding protein P-like [Piliocolobus tephrosceles]